MGIHYPGIAVQHYIVRANRGKSRIWIQGKKLTAAGFLPGRFYSVTRRDNLTLNIMGVTSDGSNPVIDGGEVRKISGKGTTPIIDLSGKGCSPFKTGDPVTVIYSTGCITITKESGQ